MAKKEINDIPVTRIHSYNVAVAADVGINAAVIFYNICFWVEENTANERNFINGEYWTYNTINAFKTLFPEMTYEQVRNALRKLEDNNYIKSAFLNEDTRDRTKWYTVVDKKKWITSNKCNCENSHMGSEKSQMENDSDTDVNNIYNNKITDTDNNSANNNQAVNKHADNSHKGENINKVNGEVKTYFSENRRKMSVSKTKTAKQRYIDKKAEEVDMLNRLWNICNANYEKETANEIFNTLEHYFKRFTEKTGLIHPILRDKTLFEITDKMNTYYDTEYSHFSNLTEQSKTFIKMVNMFFDGDFGEINGHETNWNLPVFMSDGILNRLGQRLYEAGEIC